MERKIEIFEAIWQILDVADIDSLTIRETAQRCNLHANTVDYYFENKDDMLLQFHEYVASKDNDNLPVYFTNVPDNIHPALAVADIVDYAIFHSDRVSRARFKLNRYLIPRMKDNERIKRYIVDGQDTLFDNYNSILNMYADAGYVKRSVIEESIYDLFIVSAGFGIENYFGYDSRYTDKVMRYQSKKIKKTLLLPEYHPLLEGLGQ